MSENDKVSKVETKISVIRKSTIVYMPDENHTSYDQEVEAIDVSNEMTIEELINNYDNLGNPNERNVSFEIRKLR